MPPKAAPNGGMPPGRLWPASSPQATAKRKAGLCFGMPPRCACHLRRCGDMRIELIAVETAGQLLTVGHLCPFPQLFSVAVGCAVYRHPPSSSPPFLRGCSRPVRRPSDARASTGLHCSMLRPTASFLCRLPSSRIKCVSALHFSAWPLQGGPRPCKPTDLQVLSLARSRLSRLASADPLCVARTGIIIHYTVYDVLHRYRARRRDACWSLAECIADAVTATPARIRLVLTRPISGLPTPQLALTTAQATPGARAVGLPSVPLMCR